jgi:hypothetical protein
MSKLTCLDWAIALTALASAAFWGGSAYASYEHREKSKYPIVGAAQASDFENLQRSQSRVALLNMFAAGFTAIAAVLTAIKAAY